MATNDQGITVQRQYIGARYVPKFFQGPDGTPAWIGNVPYEPLIIVTYLGNSYTSKIPVPSGIGNPSLNPTYWALTGNFNAQLQQVSSDVETMKETVNEVTQDISEINDKINNLDLNIVPFASVAEMQAGKLSEGIIVNTNGYYAENDGGNNQYVISTTNAPGAIPVKNNLYAVPLIITPLDIRKVGAKGDGVTDNTQFINLAFQLATDVYVPDQTFACHQISIPSDKRISGFGTLKLITSETTEKLLRVDGNENVEIDGLTLIGDRGDTGNTNEYKAAIYVQNAKNVTIKNCKISNCRGDGIGTNAETPSSGETNYFKNDHIVIDNCNITNCYRNGISITATDNTFITNCRIDNTNGMSPGAAIDIEPNYSYQYCNVFIDNLYSSANKGCGVQIRLTHSSGEHKIVINNWISNYEGSDAIALDKGILNIFGADPGTCQILVSNAYIRGAYIYPVLISGPIQNNNYVSVDFVASSIQNNKAALYVIPIGTQANNCFDVKMLIKNTASPKSVKTASGNINGGRVTVKGYGATTELASGTNVTIEQKSFIYSA